ncbi:MAG: hypothetical protein EOS36_07655 [Mesorhizobium sp.]|uniref:nuclear transport factor 2 family protein n=1 Tax=Mesorhizobium sp. TaxID=1871066 RepID=UPI000FE48006|nr:nuclear transport factor 2 family protein [Mesorhizobium sp.]RWD65465.1 MAG: hypothetical protein EOS36_07655 [Mesorhizobium sp.]RWE37502.1 MAG: hypothetical protein EOS79_24770 [Mesorhizobium sp.]
MTTPDPIRRFVEATNAGDSEVFLDTFAADALLTDWGRSFRGRFNGEGDMTFTLEGDRIASLIIA